MKETVWKLKKVCNAQYSRCPYYYEDGVWFIRQCQQESKKPVNLLTNQYGFALRHPDCPLTEIVMR